MAAESEIFAALMTKLAAFTASPVLPVSYPNVSFTPPANQRYIRAQFVPNTTNRVLIDTDGPHQHLGFLQVSVYWTKGQGEAGPRAVAAAIADHFPADLRLTSGGVSVRITARPSVRDLIIEDAAVQVPVLIPYECWA
jgi:hypothetical protein